MSSAEAGVLPSDIYPEDWFNPEYLNFRRPEVTEFIKKLAFAYDPEIENGICPTDRVRGLLAEAGFEHSAELDFKADKGTIDISELHIPVAERLAERDEVLLPGLSGFKYRYATANGSTEGIDQLMVGLRAEKKMTKIGLIRGDYLGYIGAALSKDIEFQWAGSLEEVGEPEDGVVWFVSNPRAINGNLYTTKVWQDFLASGNKVVVDAAYVDLTVEGSVDVSSPNVIAVLTSPSKPYGFVGDKYPAIVHLRERVNELYLHRKFKNISRLLIAMELQLQEDFGPHKIAELHQPTQLEICKDLSAVAGGDILPSDATLVAHATGSLHPNFGPYKKVNMVEREEDYTLRLTKEFARRALLGHRG